MRGLVLALLLNCPCAAASVSGAIERLRWSELPDYGAETRKFYEKRSFSPAWIKDGALTRQGGALIKIFENAARAGLEPEDYDGSRWAGRLARPISEAELARLDADITVCAMRYLSDLATGRIDPKLFEFGLEVRRQKAELPRFLAEELVDAPDIDKTLARVEPPFPAYRRTVKALGLYRRLAERQDKPLPAPKRPLKPGASYRAAPRLARLLRLLGDLPSRPKAAGSVYDGALVKAVQRFQRRHGLEPDGILGRETLQELNTPLSRRVAQLQLTLERWRWISRDFSRPPLIVNIPEFRLRAVDMDFRPILSIKVVVGQAYDKYRTPIFSGEMEAVTFRPYWNVPASIQKSELASEFEKNPALFSKLGYEVLESSGETFLRQKPGPENALGAVKFEMPNKYDVYLHGTPAQELFAKSRRDFSHGCIRVEDPAALAAWVLREEPNWNAGRIQAAIDGTETLRVKLAKPIPVLILYGTAIVLESGEVRFFRDIYGHDEALQNALKGAASTKLPVNSPGIASHGA